MTTTFYYDKNNSINMSMEIEPSPSINVQSNKNVTIESNTVTEVTPDSGYDALQKITVTTQVPTQSSQKITKIQVKSNTYILSELPTTTTGTSTQSIPTYSILYIPNHTSVPGSVEPSQTQSTLFYTGNTQGFAFTNPTTYYHLDNITNQSSYAKVDLLSNDNTILQTLYPLGTNQIRIDMPNTLL